MLNKQINIVIIIQLRVLLDFYQLKVNAAQLDNCIY